MAERSLPRSCGAMTGDVVSWFFFSSRRRHTRCSRDWSSDVCSSDLIRDAVALARAEGCSRLVGVSLYPQWCSATTGSAFFDLRKAVAGSLPLAEVDRYPDRKSVV